MLTRFLPLWLYLMVIPSFGRVVYTALVVAVWVLPVPAHACPVCLPMPQTTAADRLINSQIVVFAREDPHKPFSYRTVNVLKGNPATTGVDLFINSSTRRRLSANPTHVAVLCRTDENSPWISLGIADQVYQQVVRRILALSREWNGGSVSDSARF